MEQSNSKKIIKGISSQTIVTISLGVVEILYFSLMSRILSREVFGLFAAITAVTSIFQSLSNAGIGSALIQKKEMNEDYKNTAFTLSIIFGGGVALLLIFLAKPLSILIIGEDLYYPLMVMSITIIVSSVLSVYMSWFYRNLQFLIAGFVNFVSLITSSLLAVFLAIKGMGLIAIISRVLLNSILMLFISYFVVNTSFKFQIKKKYIGEILNFGGWLTASVMLNSISSQIDRLMMSRLLSVEALGVYNRPKEFILQIGGKVNSVFDSALFPVLSSIQDEKEKLRRAFNSSQYIMNFCSMLLTLTFVCNSQLIIRVFFGEKWLDINLLFQIISLALLFNVNGRLTDCFFRSLGFVKQQFYFRFFELIFCVASILLGFKFGLIGVATCFLISNIFIIFVKIYYIIVKIEISFFEMMKCVFGGWRIGSYFVPFIIAQYYVVPTSFFDCVVYAIFFVLLMVLILFNPVFLGRKYKETIYDVFYIQVNKYFQ